MCGLTGFLQRFGGDAQNAYNDIQNMCAAITHRGPDSAGHWADPESTVVLGHRRLSIIDLSPSGHQPMISACGRYVMAFNGEIYNHLDLRSRLETAHQAPSWRSHSDTETLLAAFSAWGIDATLQAANGMFAIALWDRSNCNLTLARDRFGEKPLYYGFARGRAGEQITGTGPLLFGSELKALVAHSEWQGTLATDALEGYLRYGCIGGEASIYEGVAKLPPGSRLSISRSHMQAGEVPAPTIWWSADQAAREAQQDKPFTQPDDAVSAVEVVLGRAVRKQMMSDVPLGAFLSGGIDSSLIVALMQQQMHHPVRTFSVGFEDPRYDESHHAEAVATHLGTEHTTLHATADMALALVPNLCELYDEPFADSSQLPTTIISKLTREHVTVALSGDGGDELFGGYNRHLWVPRIWQKLQRLPKPARRALAASLKAIRPATYDRFMKLSGRVLPSQFQIRTFGEKVLKLASVLESQSEKSLFAGVSSMNRQPAELMLEGTSENALGELRSALTHFDGVEWMLLMDTLHYMVDDVLVKVDRASMASSLEVRVPFLDPDVFHTAWRIPASVRMYEGQSKWVLRQLLYRHVPRDLVERPKMGFAVPLDTWLRGPLKEWVEDLLSSASFTNLPMLDASRVRRMWQEHLLGQGHYSQQLWTVLQLLAWQRRWKAGLP